MPADPAADALPQETIETIAFLMVPDFSMIAFAAAIEPLRLAVRTAGRPVYRWRLLSASGQPVTASNGVSVAVDGSFAAIGAADAAIVCSGLNVQAQDTTALRALLHRLAARGAALGALCTGTHVLARAGVVSGRRVTIHWENHAALAADFPALDISRELFEIDRDRFTCAGGAAALDMMLKLIARDHGAALARQVADQLIHSRIRDGGDQQRGGLETALALAPGPLRQVSARMEATIAAPVPLARLAGEAGLSVRQLERLFRQHLNTTPARHYQTLRLERARALLRQTAMSIVDVALECGFGSASHFSTAFADHFGRPPSRDRSPEGPAARRPPGT
ncbi:GlxA family transcriptional regulator [Pseudoxanthobacter sp.]|uniref:GlxA family transcriptional regulator n=1 Tax=Pseudoxanthobacter sp. TaxID=1925742 RepID=UPI002FDF6333